MPKCPVCDDAHLEQLSEQNGRLFKCSNPECPIGYFTLIDRRDLKANAYYVFPEGTEKRVPTTLGELLKEEVSE